MKMTLTSPRSRPQHLTTISGPEDCDAQVLRFTAENGISILGERDSSSGSYHLWLPSLVGGQVINFDVDEEKEEKPASGIAHMIGEDQVEVSLIVYNLQGREVTRLVDKTLDAGYHSIKWHADSYPSGLYFVHMIAGKFNKTQKLMLIK